MFLCYYVFREVVFDLPCAAAEIYFSNSPLDFLNFGLLVRACKFIWTMRATRWPFPQMAAYFAY